MIDSLAGVHLKLLRADQHPKVLGDELAAFHAGEPYRIAHEINADGTEHIFKTQILKQPPPLLSAIISDTLQNMRACLEYLAWGLAWKDKGSEPDRRITSFPIPRTESDFWSTNKTTGALSTGSGAYKISGITRTSVRSAIQQLQPYKTGKDELYILNELARVDRHQRLRVIGGANVTVSQSWRRRGSGVPFDADFDMLRPPGSVVTITRILVDDAEVGLFHFREPEVEVRFDFPRYVAFHDAGPAFGKHALGLLTAIRNHVANDVVAKLERYL